MRRRRQSGHSTEDAVTGTSFLIPRHCVRISLQATSLPLRLGLPTGRGYGRFG